MQNYYLTKKEDKWVLRKEKSTTNLVSEDTKEEATASMIKYMKKGNKEGSVRIHKENGQFQEERTYPSSADPSSSQG